MIRSVFGRLGGSRTAAVVFATAMLAALVLALMAGPARAIDDDPCPDCEPPVNNPPTVAANNGSRTISEGQTVTNTGTYSDADGIAGVTLSASVGNVTKNPNGTWNWSFNTSDGPDQSQTVTITANDGTDTATTTFTLDVNNVAPTVSLQGLTTVQEGGALANGYTSHGYNLSVSDRGNDTWTLNTGCGANGSEWQESQFQVWCGFFDGPGSSVVSATATDSDGAIGNTASVNVSVTNRNPDATLNAPVSINEGGTAMVSLTKGNFMTQDGQTDTDAGFRYAFACNGGSLAAATYASSGASNSTTCAYDDNNPSTDKGTLPPYTVRAEIMDKDGGSNEYTKNITVNNVAPTATLGSPASVNQGSNFTLSLSGVSDSSSADSASLTYAFDCGDGSGYVLASNPNKGCTASLDQPTITVKGKVTDKDGGSNEYTANVSINNVYPTGTIQINNAAATTADPVVNLALSATDPPPGSNVGQMRFRNENTQTWSSWEPYQPGRQWRLSDGDGPKTVFVEYKDNAGNISQGAISDDIQLDTSDSTAPTVQTWNPKGRKVPPRAKPIITFSEKMNEASVVATDTNGLPTTFFLKRGTTVIPASVSYTSDGTTFKATLTSTGKLKAGARYTVTVTSDATDEAGNALVAKSWVFTVKR